MLVSAVTTDIADRFPDPHQRPIQMRPAHSVRGASGRTDKNRSDTVTG